MSFQPGEGISDGEFARRPRPLSKLGCGEAGQVVALERRRGRNPIVNRATTRAISQRDGRVTTGEKSVRSGTMHMLGAAHTLSLRLVLGMVTRYECSVVGDRSSRPFLIGSRVLFLLGGLLCPFVLGR